MCAILMCGIANEFDMDLDFFLFQAIYSFLSSSFCVSSAHRTFCTRVCYAVRLVASACIVHFHLAIVSLSCSITEDIVSIRLRECVYVYTARTHNNVNMRIKRRQIHSKYECMTLALLCSTLSLSFRNNILW